MTLIEAGAALFGVASVIATVKRSVWCWPLGLAQVVLYVHVFYDAKLYGDALLHVIFAGLQVVGWRAWATRRAADGHIAVTLLDATGRLVACAVALLGMGVVGMTLAAFTDAALPWADSFVLSTSLVATWLLAKRALESWIAWIVVDVVAIPLFFARDLSITAWLYVVFLGLSIRGLFAWHKELHRTTLHTASDEQ